MNTDTVCSPFAPVPATTGYPVFGPDFRESLLTLFRWRRDERHFDPTPFDDDLVELFLDAACLAPSVGNSQPWRFVSVDDPANRAAIAGNFARANADALAGYSGERAQLYSTLKLEGLRDAPRQFAVAKQLRVPADWALVAYLCVGRPLKEFETPELERVGWQARTTTACRKVLQR
jgi:5,6-dimethylbenzimidazole synthase